MCARSTTWSGSTTKKRNTDIILQHECNLTPRVDSASYRAILRERQAKAAEPKRRLVTLSFDVSRLKAEDSPVALALLDGIIRVRTLGYKC